ncbi:hypothetical protein [Roseivivax sediminis]|uniref:Uncharacterized protein n=1 Tax=Roseivivax sediminis TaxID=936889 RepID=A0A1I2DHX4_9RHOB|nr:hypothetical protein [Roseivivax sediminis]SFE80205.1 hypothetical protein SAMN04515678_11712 [Roseivivax sediminis]
MLIAISVSSVVFWVLLIAMFMRPGGMWASEVGISLGVAVAVFVVIAVALRVREVLCRRTTDASVTSDGRRFEKD